MANLAEVLKELQSERDRLEQAIKALQPLVSMNGQPGAGSEGRRPRLSVAARRRIAAAQRARWARVRAGKQQTTANSAKPRARVVSIAARRKMAAAQKARRSRERAQQAKKAA